MTELHTVAKRQKKAALIIIALSVLVIAAIITAAFIVGSENYERSRLKSAVNGSLPNSNEATVADYLIFWNFTSFSEELIEAFEARYQYYYYKEIGDTASVARATANYFLDNRFEETYRKGESAVSEAIAGSYIAAIGDKYGYYRTAAQSNQFNSTMSGTTIGIGVTVTKDAERGIPIIDVIENSPAMKAGLAAGDIIIAIDGVSIVGKDYNQSVNKISGEKGTEIEITVKRGESVVTVTAIRDEVIQKTVSGKMLDNGIGYIKISSFKKNTDELFAEELDKLIDAGAVGIIFDLSVNPGGYLNSVTNMLSYLTPTGTKLAGFSSAKEDILSTDGTELEPDDRILSVPAVVICSQHTASAGELFTGAIKDFREMGIMNASVVGKTTYKKGVMQSTFSLVGGATVTITTAYYLSPLGNNYDENGVTPDIYVDNETDYLSEAISEMHRLLSQ